MKRLRKWEKDILKKLVGNGKIEEDTVTIIECDGETARRIGEMTSRLGIRDDIDISKESNKDKSIIIDENGELDELIDAIL